METQKDGLPSSDPESIDLPLFCPGGEQEISVVSEMTSTPHKDKGGHQLTAHWDRTTHRGGHRHSSTARHRWELADIGSRREEARRPDQIPRERQCRVSV